MSRIGLPCLVTTIAGLFLAARSAVADDAYFEVPITQLKITNGKLPAIDEEFGFPSNWRARSVMIPYAVLDGPGEVFLGKAVGREIDVIRDTLRENRQVGRKNKRPVHANPLAVAIRVPKRRTVAGTLYVPNRNYTGMVPARFAVPAASANSKAKQNFYLTKSDHYLRLQELNLPGGAWFRQQAELARSIATGKELLEPIAAARSEVPDGLSRSGMEDTFRVFTGGRAISENLQLDRMLRSTKPAPPGVDIKSLPGISVAEMDWTTLTKDIHPEVDPLAKLVPHDQHALFFPSFGAMTQMLDEANSFGTPLLHLLQSRAENARSKERYERQLCLEMNALSRLLGPKIIGNVAFTGSDPYLRTGTDVAVLFEAKSHIAMRQFVLSKHAAAQKTYTDCNRVKGTVAGVDYVGVVTPDRRVSSYVATMGDVVVVTNSLVQLERLSKTHGEKVPSLASLPEYQFFRHRYRRGAEDETAFLIVTDATIRRWCGPKWRIATSRRTRAAAIMSHYQAVHLPQLVKGVTKSTPITTRLYVPDLGTLLLTKDGVTSSEYGSLEFMTPIAELDFDKVTSGEAMAYRRWRDSYQWYWRQFFDPIAVRFSVQDKRVSADVTVLPLIKQTDYGDLIQLTTGRSIPPQAGDRHPDSLVHWAMALNPKSLFVGRIVEFLPFNPLSWLGDSIAVYADADPFWVEFANAKDKEEFIESQIHRLPVAFRAEVKSGLKLALFLTTLRAYIDKSAPGMIEWKTLKHQGQPYVKMKATNRLREEIRSSAKDLAVYYVATSDALTVTFNERVLKRAIEREVARRKIGKTKKHNTEKSKRDLKPWLGSQVALQLDGKALGLAEAYFGEDYRQTMQSRAWANLPVLNEWKRRYPKRDPVQMHEQFWGIELRCPGGGKYAWNEKYDTMESTQYGHPAAPKAGPKLPPILREIRSANFGLTFERKGLRARMALLRGRRP